ncbi:MAG: ABC-type transport auxiliary lipoprotein family protein [Candidatus Zhuqueibacterota bacterium]
MTMLRSYFNGQGNKTVVRSGKILVVMLALFLHQCGGSAPDMHFYLIDYPVAMKSSGAGTTHDVVLGVNRFKVHPLYDEARLVYRDSPYEGKYYHYHVWVTNPADMVTDKAVEHLAASGMFASVLELPQFSVVDYTMSGTILALEEWDEADQWFAHVKLAVELIDMKTETIIWQKMLERKNAVAKKTPLDVVKGLNLGIQQCFDEVQQGIDELLSKR